MTGLGEWAEDPEPGAFTDPRTWGHVTLVEIAATTEIGDRIRVVLGVHPPHSGSCDAFPFDALPVELESGDLVAVGVALAAGRPGARA